MSKTAVIIGATGLTGSELLRLLLKDSRFDKVKILVRRPSGISHTKLVEHIVDFAHPENWKKLLTSDVLYLCMGTTLRAAGSKAAQFEVDYTYQFNTAKYAAACSVHTCVLVSAAGSAIDSPVFYSRLKGRLERDIRKLPFETIHIMQPGLLTGRRQHTRLGEVVAGAVLSVVSALPGLNGLRPQPAVDLALAMVHATFRQTEGIHLYPNARISSYARLEQQVRK